MPSASRSRREQLGLTIDHQAHQDKNPQEIPSAFYAQVLRALSITPEPVCFWAMCSIILQQAVNQLDPERRGILLVVLRCAAPGEDKKIHSLQECVGVGTPPWRSEFAERRQFLGVESLAGHVVTSGRSAVIQSMQENPPFLPVCGGTYAGSCAAFPICLNGCVAGCLHISSTIPDYFHPARLTLIQRYVDLLILVFPREDFHDPRAIELRPMPPLAAQQSYLNAFAKRVAQVLRTTAEQEQSIGKRQAEYMVWQEIEAALLQYP